MVMVPRRGGASATGNTGSAGSDDGPGMPNPAGPGAAAKSAGNGNVGWISPG
ncbi:hypothetical protein NSERUTF1_2130 [Nocardia seriolae]|nr:hypothetical protein NSERUTF1_2130 [Nocardia seriolae]